MAKRMMMEQDEQGWSYTDKFVCTACVDDYALEDAIVSVESTDETWGLLTVLVTLPVRPRMRPVWS